MDTGSSKGGFICTTSSRVGLVALRHTHVRVPSYRVSPPVNLDQWHQSSSPDLHVKCSISAHLCVTTHCVYGLSFSRSHVLTHKFNFNVWWVCASWSLTSTHVCVCVLLYLFNGTSSTNTSLLSFLSPISTSPFRTSPSLATEIRLGMSHCHKVSDSRH